MKQNLSDFKDFDLGGQRIYTSLTIKLMFIEACTLILAERVKKIWINIVLVALTYNYKIFRSFQK